MSVLSILVYVELVTVLIQEVATLVSVHQGTCLCLTRTVWVSQSCVTSIDVSNKMAILVTFLRLAAKTIWRLKFYVTLRNGREEYLCYNI